MQVGQVPPPQSTSVSTPFFRLSEQLAVTQVPPMQLPPTWQSPSMLQCLPAAHLVAQLPPQSMSVSLPFFTLSPQLATWQVTLHTPLRQSLAPAQSLPSVHFGQPEPQSLSVSVPFFTPSVQLAA
jgi:hypothetical protein